MVAPRYTRTDRAALSFNRLRELTAESGAVWADLLIEDYQGILQDFIYTADEIDAIDVRITQNEADILQLQIDVADLQERVTELEYKTFTEIEITEDYTTEQFQVINCRNTAAIEITLKTTAVKDDELHIKRNNEAVTLVGVIDGENDYILPAKWSLHLVYNGTDWSSI